MLVLADLEQRDRELEEYAAERRRRTEALQGATTNIGSKRLELVNRRRRKKRAINLSKQSTESKLFAKDNLSQQRQAKSQQ